jgi:hypothetical protein
MERARPVLEKARDSGAAFARRSARVVVAAGRKGGAVRSESDKQVGGDEISDSPDDERQRCGGQS